MDNMPDEPEQINQLLERLETLLKKQEIFNKEVSSLREEIYRLELHSTNQVKEKTDNISDSAVKVKIKQNLSIPDISKTKEPTKEELKPKAKTKESVHIKADLEKFIGENLINKVGIIITVVGVSIGSKYAIDHQLISPLTRIIIGYLVGTGLLLFAFRLKKAYSNFSAVLFSGSVAIMYFITYTAFSFYNLFPWNIAFLLMVSITVLSVFAAINYNRQVIAHIGLVGAYAIPFLLNKGSEDITLLFSYMAIINMGILFISFKKYWKPLYYFSFLLTWLIYLVWFWQKYESADFELASAFLIVFFVTFYLMFLVYKLLRNDKFEMPDIILVLANSFIFYGLGYSILSRYDNGEHLLGLFTFCNAIVHSIVSLIIYRGKLADKNLFYFVTGLFLVFIAITIPVQLNGNWVTLLWAGQAAVLFLIGRTQKVRFYEILSYVIMVLAFYSLIQDWAYRDHLTSSLSNTRIIPVFNINFLSTILFASSFGFINYLNYKPGYPSPFSSKPELKNLVNYFISGVLILTLYYSFENELTVYWNQLYKSSFIGGIAEDNLPADFRDEDLLIYRNIWIINYSVFFFSVLSAINIKKILNQNLGYINLVINTILMIVFLTYGLYILSDLRESYLDQTLSGYYHRGSFNIGIRYISLVFAGMTLASIKMYVDAEFLKPVPFDLKMTFDIFLYTSLIWIISSELISWMDILNFSQTYKLGLSILWGVYAFLLIGFGIWKKKKHLRIAAIVLFAITLIKLFLYDISHLETIAKTIILISLGILLLLVSFLYIKYKNVISEEAG
jgi:hypothetical protein